MSLRYCQVCNVFNPATPKQNNDKRILFFCHIKFIDAAIGKAINPYQSIKLLLPNAGSDDQFHQDDSKYQTKTIKVADAIDSLNEWRESNHKPGISRSNKGE